VRCVELAAESPAARREFRVFNQFTGQHSVLELAQLVRRTASRLGFDVEIAHRPNPRVEAETHYYRAANRSLLDLGLRPHQLSYAVIASLIDVAVTWRERIDPEVILPRVAWDSQSAVVAGQT
jgi:UDP-sulfoquinovose synthase